MHRHMRIGGGTLDANSLNTLRTGPYEGKIAGLYDLEETLGRGHFAVVKLARHVFTGEKVAVKVIDKSKLDEVSKAHLFQEVRCMKLVQHPNVVRLYEVIDTATKLYLILELGDGGDLYDYIMRHDTGLSEQLAKEYFRQIVRAISYCHQLHVVHRDLKPENVVFFEKLGVVKLTDFGFSNKFCPGQKLETSCGSLAYSAPEILLGDSYDAPAVDVWSLGVILYMLVCGQAPFQEANDSETLTMIMDCKYNVPPHVSKQCRDLIGRMLVRNPEKRATLAEIANHPWLEVSKQDNPPLDVLPLVSREQVSEDDHNLIVQKIVNGKIATKEEIQECLDKNEYNHITATYYLLAERKLKSKRQDQLNKSKRPEFLAVPHNSPAPKRDNNGTAVPCLLTVPRTPGDIPPRSRKCSIVQEDEEEEDISNCSGREELAPPLNRRGSRSEGRLNLALQERLAESERKKLPINEKIENTVTSTTSGVGVVGLVGGGVGGGGGESKHSNKTNNLLNNKSNNLINNNQHLKWRMGKSTSLVTSPVQVKVIKDMSPQDDVITTTIITDSSTISIPIITTNTSLSCQTLPKYKTMPSPTRTTNNTITGQSPLQLNEIFEESDGQTTATTTPRSTSRQFVSRNQNRSTTTYEQRRSKFHKARTASCSSSDASDDDSEKRKKRAHKLNNTSNNKPFQGRRDSHDDSSDSQEPGTGASTSNRINNSNNVTTTTTVQSNTNSNNTQHNNNNNNSDNKNGSSTNRNKNTQQQPPQQHTMLGRRHKASRRRNGETRLRESQSLNRITEVQEDGGAHALVITTSIVGTQNVLTPKVKGIGAKLLQGFNSMTTMKKNVVVTTNTNTNNDNVDNNKSCMKSEHISRKDTIKNMNNENNDCNNKIVSNNNNNNDRSGGLKKMKLLGKYFQVHKKLCIPSLPGLFNRNRLYKAQSCSSLARDKINLNSDNLIRCRKRAVSVIRNSDGDINQNDKIQGKASSTVVQLNNVCNELTGICAVHLGQASKCCSFC